MKHRLEVSLAWCMGFALPLLEMARRRTHFFPLASYADDFIAGGLLLWAAYASHRRMRSGDALLCAAWGVVCGGFYYSFFGQLERGPAADISGIRGTYVVIIKGFLFSAAIMALALSVRHAAKSRTQ